MKLKVTRTKKETVIRFRTETNQDARDLKAAILASMDGAYKFNPAGVIGELAKIWNAEAKKKKGKEPA